MSFLTQVGPCDTISVTAYYAAHLCHHHNSVIQAHCKALGTSAHTPKRTHVSFSMLYSGQALLWGQGLFPPNLCVLIKRNTINRKLEGVALRHSLVHPTAHSHQRDDGKMFIPGLNYQKPLHVYWENFRVDRAEHQGQVTR